MALADKPSVDLEIGAVGNVVDFVDLVAVPQILLRGSTVITRSRCRVIENVI